MVVIIGEYCWPKVAEDRDGAHPIIYKTHTNNEINTYPKMSVNPKLKVNKSKFETLLEEKLFLMNKET